MKNLKDKIIKCQNCRQEFCWTAEEQQFYKQKGLKAPTHCLICRAALKEARKDKFRGKLS